MSGGDMILLIIAIFALYYLINGTSCTNINEGFCGSCPDTDACPDGFGCNVHNTAMYTMGSYDYCNSKGNLCKNNMGITCDPNNKGNDNTSDCAKGIYKNPNQPISMFALCTIPGMGGTQKCKDYFKKLCTSSTMQNNPICDTYKLFYPDPKI
jgi:hypothetical protein